MTSRAIAAGVLVGSGLVAWLTITSTLAARLLQAVIGLSVVYVGYLAVRGFQFMTRASAVEDARTPAERLPSMSVVVAARDEAQVIEAVIDDLARQAYPHPEVGALEVIVLDHGSTDATGDLAVAAAKRAGAAKLVRLLPHDPAAALPTKGAALQVALPEQRAEVLGVLDADARLAPDALARVMAAWELDPGAAAIQARRDPTNAGHSWLTAAQAEEQAMDLASQCGRRQVDGTAELRGNGMFVRREILVRLGGWNPDAITEDLDLSTRLAAAGEHVALAPTVRIGEEAVETLSALWPQRMRWAEGSMRRLMEHGPALLAGPAPLPRKLDFLAFATEFVIPPVFVWSIVASLVTVLARTHAEWTVPATLFVGYGLGSFLLAFAGLAATGVRGWSLPLRAARGAVFLTHWLVVVPAALLRIAVLPPSRAFHKTPRFRSAADR